MKTPPPYTKLPTIQHDSAGLRVHHHGSPLLLATDAPETGSFKSVYTDGKLIWVSSYQYRYSIVIIEEYDPALATEGQPLAFARNFYIEGWNTINEEVEPYGTEGDEEDMFTALYQYLEDVN
jgi:hypothetical protein